MDAANLSYPDSHFDNILCIEAACHFMTRQKFFEEAHRVLKPGGRLAMQDALFEKRTTETVPSLFSENYLPDLRSYSDSLFNAGFRHVRVEDCTEFSVDSYIRHELKVREKEFERTRDYKALEEFSGLQKSRFHGGIAWCLVYAIK